MSDKKKPVVFISSALTSDGINPEIFEYFLNIVLYLSIQLKRNNLDLLLKVPSSHATAAKEQKQFIYQLFNNKLKNNYSALIIAPFDLDEIEEPLGKLIYRNTDFPIYTIDKGYQSIRTEKSIDPPPYVMCNQQYGGKVAAQSLAYYFKCNRIHIEKPCVVILEGLQYSEERIDGFLKEFSKICKTGAIHNETLKGKFKRLKAEQEVRNFIQDNLTNDTLIPNAFFCCNDEMSLGVRDALIEEYKKISKRVLGIEDSKRYELKERRKLLKKLNKQKLWIQNIKIVGFDYIPETKVRLADNDQWLLNTVDVNVENQVKELFDVLIKHKGETIKTKIELKPTLALKLKEQNNDYITK